MSDILDDFLKSQRKTVLVNLWEDYSEASSLMNEVMQEIEETIGSRLSVLRLSMSENRHWARRYRVMGTPCILVFHRGRYLTCLRGRMEYQDLVDKLEELGILISGATEESEHEEE